MFILNLPVFSMTMVGIPTNMAAIFDGDADSCININHAMTYRSYIKTNKIDTNPRNVTLDVKVQGVNSCLDYDFIHVKLLRCSQVMTLFMLNY